MIDREDKLIPDATYAAVWRKRISLIYTHKDLYANIIGDINLTNLNVDIVLRNKEVFEWIIQHPEYDYKGF